MADTARRMVADAASLPKHLGLMLLYVGMVVAGPTGMLVVLFSVIICFAGFQAVRGQVRARRARRWLSRNA